MFKFLKRRVQRVEKTFFGLGHFRAVTDVCGLNKTTCSVASKTVEVLGVQNNVKDDLDKERNQRVSLIVSLGSRIRDLDERMEGLMQSKVYTKNQIEEAEADLARLAKIEEIIG